MIDEKRLAELENMNDGAVFPDKLYRELLSEIRILRGINRSLEETNRKSDLQNGELKTVLKAFALGSHFHETTNGPFDPKTCPGCVSGGVLSKCSEKPKREGSCHSCIDCETINAPHECGCHEESTEKQLEPSGKCELCHPVGIPECSGSSGCYCPCHSEIR